MSFALHPDPAAPTVNGTQRLSTDVAHASAHPAGLRETTIHADLASWLVAKEISVAVNTAGAPAAAERACQKLSRGLSRVISPVGSQAVVSRALHLARAEFPFLVGVRAGLAPGACFEGLSATEVDADEAVKGLLAVLGRLLDLLVRYIGDELTLRVVWEVWPDLPVLELSQPRASNGQEAAS